MKGVDTRAEDITQIFLRVFEEQKPKFYQLFIDAMQQHSNILPFIQGESAEHRHARCDALLRVAVYRVIQEIGYEKSLQEDLHTISTAITSTLFAMNNGAEAQRLSKTATVAADKLCKHTPADVIGR